MQSFSYYPAPITNVNPSKSIELKELARVIGTDKTLKKLTDELRSLDEDGQKEFKKKRLPYVTFSGEFTRRKDDCLVKHSGLITIDLDHMNGNIPEVQERIRAALSPAMMFVSPRGSGLKVVFDVDLNEGSHGEYFTALGEFLQKDIQIDANTLDKGVKDVSRACLLCSDENVYYCDTPTVLDRDFIARYQPSEFTADVVVRNDETKYKAAESWVNKKAHFVEGNRNQYMTQLVDTLNRYGVSESYALSRCQEYAEAGFTADEITAIVKSRYNHTEHHGVADGYTMENASSVVRTEDNSAALQEAKKYIRIGVNYYKIIKKTDRYDITETHLKVWNKDTLLTDYKRKFLPLIDRYDDFIMVPDNINYRPIVNKCYNLYSPFNHVPAPGEFTWTERLLRHVFGEQYELGLRYMQILYLHPDRQTVLLGLISRERGTGKTTFVNWMNMLFGANVALISSNDFMSGFNGHYATKNIVCIEETQFEKAVIMDKLKALSTQKFVLINEKNIHQYKLSYFGKIIMTSNFENRFAKIDKEEIRFFVRKLGTPQFINHSIEDDLLKEIPAFLYYLQSLPPVDWSVSRSGFTAAELYNNELDEVVQESKSGLYKDLKMELTEFFENSDLDEFYATAKDIKERFFPHDHQVGLSYLRRVLREDFEMMPEESFKYDPFGQKSIGKKQGRPYKFERIDFTTLKRDEAPF